MKSTGIVRRVDDLGRIAIPKEVRRTLGIKEGDPMEISTEDGKVILEKYRDLVSIEDAITNLEALINEHQADLRDYPRFAKNLTDLKDALSKE